MIKLTDLVKEVVKYTDELHRTHKKVKEDEANTLDSVKTIQDTTSLLQKSKELYKQRCLELERLKRDNAHPKDLEKSEAKFKKAQEEYKNLVDKYCNVRDDFEKKMTLTSKHFQEVESAHLRQMRQFVETYCEIVDNSNNQWERVSDRVSQRVQNDEGTITMCRSLLGIGTTRVSDSVVRTDSGEPVGAVHIGQVHRPGETRSVGAI